MANNTSIISSHLQALRAQAEEKMGADDVCQLVNMTAEETNYLVHELLTHQIELELQNDELNKAQDELREKTSEYTELYDLSPVGYLTTNKKGDIVQANLTIAEMLGMNRSGLIKLQLSHFISKIHQDIFYLHQQNVIKIQEKQSCELHIHTEADGSFWASMESVAVKNTKAGHAEFRHIISDISKHKRIEEKNLLLITAISHSPNAVVITDSEGTIEYINPKYTEITGYTDEEAIGQNAGFLKSGESTKLEYFEMWRQIKSKGEWKGRLHNKKKDGSLFLAQNSISRFVSSDDNVTHYIGCMEDVTIMFELTNKLSYEASHDQLTKLINRREFERRANLLLAALTESDDQHAFCYIDLDQFKVVNDTCGHVAGDEMLRQLGKLLEDIVRKGDILCRLGGDEFGLLILNCSAKNAEYVANNILKALDEYQFLWQEQSFRVTASIGMIIIDKIGLNFTEIMKRADAACYLAKDAGRNRIHVYHFEARDLSEREGEMQWVSTIQQALEKDLFLLYAQPIVTLADCTKLHYELLIRLRDEDGKIIPPGAFLPAAERYNLIEKLDLWVLDSSFSLLESHPDFVEQIDSISINLSGPTLTNKVFLELIVSKLDVTGIAPDKICFEITETAAIANLNAAIKFISRLKSLGCRFALDDFGTGLSSFAYLKNMPIDYLKIDGIFVKNIVDDPIDRAMVKSINEIGHVMGMQTIAEFVENDEIKQVLKEIGVDYAQGYGLGKPEPFLELLESNQYMPTTK